MRRGSNILMSNAAKMMAMTRGRMNSSYTMKNWSSHLYNRTISTNLMNPSSSHHQLFPTFLQHNESESIYNPFNDHCNNKNVQNSNHFFLKDINLSTDCIHHHQVHFSDVIRHSDNGSSNNIFNNNGSNDSGSNSGGSSGSGGRGSSSRMNRSNKQIFYLSESAAKKVKELMNKRPNAIGLKVGVRRRGCNGMSYTLDYATEVPQNFEVVRDKGVTVFIDPKALLVVIGTRMDFVETDIREEFVWTNPNAKGWCGCNESFNV